MQNFVFKSGWQRDKVDSRDYLYTPNIMSTGKGVKAPTPVNLQQQCAPVIDQGSLGSCTSCATIAVADFVRRKQRYNIWTPSVLFTYYATRLLENTVNQDRGAYIRDALKSVKMYGIAPDLYWRYDVSKFAVRPPAAVWTEALKYQSIRYLRINHLQIDNLIQCLKDGYPFVFGVDVYGSFISQTTAATGIVTTPVPGKDNLIGGHAMTCVGFEYVGGKLRFIVRNSWGTRWGMAGYCRMDADYLTSATMAADFWTIRTMEA